MILFEALFGRKCKSPINWEEIGQRKYLGLEMVNEAEEKVHKIRSKLQIA
jgi:hypothetical protein